MYSIIKQYHFNIQKYHIEMTKKNNLPISGKIFRQQLSDPVK